MDENPLKRDSFFISRLSQTEPHNTRARILHDNAVGGQWLVCEWVLGGWEIRWVIGWVVDGGIGGWWVVEAKAVRWGQTARSSQHSSITALVLSTFQQFKLQCNNVNHLL